MKVVLDTNLLLVIISNRSKDHDIFLALLNGQFEIYVTTEILLEYEEIITRKNGPAIARAVLSLLASLSNVHFIQTYYRWNLITDDPDDNKFVYCAIAGTCDLLISDDKHFRILEKIEFPKVNLINKKGFRNILGLPII